MFWGEYIPHIAEKLDTALAGLTKSPYGFCFADVGMTAENKAMFNQIVIEKSQDFNQFGQFSKLEERVAVFLNEIGPNRPDTIKQASQKVCQLAEEVMVASRRETAWICLRTGLPNSEYDLPRWHIDGNYFPSEAGNVQYKFVVTLIGPSTLFYPIHRDYAELRKIFWRNMCNRKFLSELCIPAGIASPSRGTGAFFVASECSVGGIHSEPPIHEPRLFFSIVPCAEHQIENLKSKVMDFYRQRPPTCLAI